jgi:hypothetical protein
MSLPQPKVQMSLFDASMLLEQPFPEGDRYRVFYENILPVLWAKRDELCALYCEDNGRPAVEPVIAPGATRSYVGRSQRGNLGHLVGTARCGPECRVVWPPVAD